MNQTPTIKFLLFVSVPLALLIVVSSAIGLLNPDMYQYATLNWKLQTFGQDFVDLFLIVPVLPLSAYHSSNDNRFAQSVWGGANIYIVYTFIIYCFDVGFNSLFIVYCLILGLSFFSSIIFVYQMIKDDLIVQVSSLVRKVIGYFFIGLSLLFYFAWLSEVLPAIIYNDIPESVADAGLLTNPVHVIDLAIVLPLMFIVGLLTLRGNSLAVSMATPLLTFTILMDVTIAALAFLLFWTDVADSYMVTIVMVAHAAISVGATFILWKKIEFMRPARPWALGLSSAMTSNDKHY